MANLLKPVRRNASLGDPPEPYFNNLLESGNAVIKRALNYQPNEMSHFHIFAWRWRNWLRSRSEIARQLFSTGAHICFRRNSKVCRFHQRNGLRWTLTKGKSLCRNSEKFNYCNWTKMMTSQQETRDTLNWISHSSLVLFQLILKR